MIRAIANVILLPVIYSRTYAVPKGDDSQWYFSFFCFRFLVVEGKK
jgi:hypothetical protein